MTQAAAVESPSMSVPAGVSASPPRKYEERKAEGWCLYSASCPRRAEGWPEPTGCHCPQHALKHRKQNAKRQRERRAQLAEAGKCVRCRKPSTTYRCMGCRLLDRCDLPSTSVADGVSVDRSAKIAAATSKDPDGRTRYRGQQKRGQQPKWQLNLQDLRHCSEDWAQFVEGLQKLGGEGALKMHRSDYHSAEIAVAKVGDRVSRRMDDILERLGYFKARRGGG